MYFRPAILSWSNKTRSSLLTKNGSRRAVESESRCSLVSRGWPLFVCVCCICFCIIACLLVWSCGCEWVYVCECVFCWRCAIFIVVHSNFVCFVLFLLLCILVRHAGGFLVAGVSPSHNSPALHERRGRPRRQLNYEREGAREGQEEEAHTRRELDEVTFGCTRRRRGVVVVVGKRLGGEATCTKKKSGKVYGRRRGCGRGGRKGGGVHTQIKTSRLLNPGAPWGV